MKMKITGDSIIGELLDWDERCAEALFEAGLHCVGCPAARGETISEACEVHGIDEAALLENLRKVVC